MRRRAAIGGLIVVASLVSGCQYFGPTLDCGTVDPATCQRLADAIAAEARADDPDRRIVTLTILDDRGSYTVEFDDGTGSSLIVD